MNKKRVRKGTMEKSAISENTSIRPVDIGRNHQVLRGRVWNPRVREAQKKKRDREAELCGDVETRSMTLDEYLSYGLVARDEEGRLYVPKKS